MAISRRAFLVSSTAALAASRLGRNAAAAPESEPNLVRFQNPRKYSVEHTVTVTNTDARMTEVELWVPVPQDAPEQTVTELTVSPPAPVFKSKHGGASVAKLLTRGGLPGPGESISLTASYTIERSEVVGNVPAILETRGEYKKSAELTSLLRAETKIETGDRVLAQAAKQFQSPDEPPAKTAFRIYEWLLDRTTYQLVEGFQGAKVCHKNGVGECGDYSALFVAMCRLCGIPARICPGYWAVNSDDPHVWAEFQLPGGEWIPVDPAIGDRGERQRKTFFGGLDNERVTLTRTADIDLVNSGKGHSRMEFLQVGAAWWSLSRMASPPTWKASFRSRPAEKPAPKATP